jgi:hypothetical protein
VRYDEIASPEHDPPVVGAPPTAARLGAVLRQVAPGAVTGRPAAPTPADATRAADAAFAGRLDGFAERLDAILDSAGAPVGSGPEPAPAGLDGQEPAPDADGAAGVIPVAADRPVAATPTVQRSCRRCGPVEIVPGLRRCPRGHRLQHKHGRRSH